MGAKSVFGVLLIGVGILAAYLAITGQLQAVWTMLSTGQSPNTTSPQATTAPTTTSNAPATTTMPISTAGVPAAPPPYLPSTTASQIQSVQNGISAIEQYQPWNTFPSSATTVPTAPISSLPSVYSTTLAMQSGVTGQVS